MGRSGQPLLAGGRCHPDHVVTSVAMTASAATSNPGEANHNGQFVGNSIVFSPTIFFFPQNYDLLHPLTNHVSLFSFLRCGKPRPKGGSEQ